MFSNKKSKKLDLPGGGGRKKQNTTVTNLQTHTLFGYLWQFLKWDKIIQLREKLRNQSTRLQKSSGWRYSCSRDVLFNSYGCAGSWAARSGLRYQSGTEVPTSFKRSKQNLRTSGSQGANPSEGFRNKSGRFEIRQRMEMKSKLSQETKSSQSLNQSDQQSLLGSEYKPVRLTKPTAQGFI